MASSYSNTTHGIIFTDDDVTSNGSQPEIIDCRTIIAVATAVSAVGHGDHVSYEAGNGSSTSQQWELARFYVATVLIPSLCVVGVVGNVFSVVVFTRRRMKVGLKFHIEQAGYEGLIALAVSDSICCLSGLVAATATGGNIRVVYTNEEAWQLYIRLYVPCVQNAFVRTSTWLTLLTAACRYAAICRPIHARRLIGVRETRISVVAVFVLSAALELPSVWTFDVLLFECIGDAGRGGGRNASGDSVSTSPDVQRDFHLLLVDHGPFEQNVPLRTAFAVIWTAVGFVIPAGALSFCNFQLVRSLRESAKLRSLVCRISSPRNIITGGVRCTRCCRYRGRVHYRGRSGSQPDRLTPTLIAIVGAFLVLVAPSEIVLYIGRYANDLVRQHAEPHGIFLTVANLLQTIDFAFNFLLYCVVNVQFRDTCRHLVLGVLCYRSRRRRRHRETSRLMMTSAIGRRRVLLELGTGFAVVGTPSLSVANSHCLCGSTWTRRTAYDCGTRDLSIQRRHRGATKLSLTVTTTVNSHRRSSAGAGTAITVNCDRRKQISNNVIETDL